MSTPPSTGSRWTADPEAYDRWFEGQWGRYAFGVEQRALLEALGDPADARVVDVGCGTGRFTDLLHRRRARVLGIEPEVGMLAVARRHTVADLVRAEGHHLPVADGACDLAVAVTTCEFADDPAAVVAELTRVTRPGGRVVVAALNRRSPWGVAHRARFRRPPWDRAWALDGTALLALGAPHGDTIIRPALYAPGPGPLIDRWGPPIDRIGRWLAPSWGAFLVLVIDRPPPDRDR